MTTKKPFAARHGDVIIREISEAKLKTAEKDGKKLDHLTLALGEKTGHSHRVEGVAHLFSYNEKLHLKALEEVSVLHQEHCRGIIPPGSYEIVIHQEYDDSGEWVNVLD